MNALTRSRIFAIAVLVVCVPAAVSGTDLRDSLKPQDINVVRINLNPWGARLGFETEVSGDDPRVEALTTLIRQAEPGGGHKCANAGAIRFRMRDGSIVGVGLLPSHTEGLYELRLYEDARHVANYRVSRASLLAALTAFGVPMEDPAFRE